MRSRKREELKAGSFDGRHLHMRVFPTSGGAAVLFHNTTEQHVLRQRLERGEALGDAVRRHSGAAAIRLDSRARVEAVDDLFCVWSGFSGGDIVGHRFVDLISQPLRRESGELLERVLREAVTAEISLILLGKRGDEMPGVLALAPIMIDCVAHGAQALWAPGVNKLAERAA
jgi:PAS domain-containing protein